MLIYIFYKINLSNTGLSMNLEDASYMNKDILICLKVESHLLYLECSI